MQNANIDYFPFEKALVLKGQDQEEDLKKELEELKSFVGENFSKILEVTLGQYVIYQP